MRAILSKLGFGATLEINPAKVRADFAFFFKNRDTKCMKKFILPFLCLCLTLPARAAKIIAVKDTRVMIDSEGDFLSAGDRFIGRDGSGKGRVLVEVKQVKNNRAIAHIIKGRAEAPMSLSPAGAPATKASSSRPSSSKNSAGLMLGFANNAMTVKPGGGASVSLSGSSFSLSGLYQMPIGGAFGARLLAGYETLTASGTGDGTVCTSCEVDLSYLGVEALAKYSFVQNSSMDVWVGAGLGFLFAMNKSSNILDTSKISTSQTIVGALGLDWRLSATTFIPVQFDYAMYPDNSTSSATQMILRAGYGFSF